MLGFNNFIKEEEASGVIEMILIIVDNYLTSSM